jgi:hypothetical protein
MIVAEAVRRAIACPTGLALIFAVVTVPSPASADTPEPLSPQTMQLPSGPMSFKGLREAF